MARKKKKAGNPDAARKAFIDSVKTNSEAWAKAKEQGGNRWKPPCGDYEVAFVGMKFIDKVSTTVDGEKVECPAMVPRFRIEDGELADKEFEGDFIRQHPKTMWTLHRLASQILDDPEPDNETVMDELNEAADEEVALSMTVGERKANGKVYPEFTINGRLDASGEEEEDDD